MSLGYGFVKALVVSPPKLQSKNLQSETQYHLHLTLEVGSGTWDVAVNVGTNDADDALKYKLVYDFHHAGLLTLLSQAPSGYTTLTGCDQLPALDFLRSDVLAETGPWRDSDVMDGSEAPEPIATLKRLVISAQQQQWPLYVFGRIYTEGNGIHDIHMNQGSTGSFLHKAGNDKNDHNDVWQDGAVFVNQGQNRWATYVSAFTQQLVPTDDLGNPEPGAKPIGDK